MKGKAEEILKDLKAGKYAPVYFLQGEESFDINRITDYIERHVLSEAEKGFNQTVLYGREVSSEQILAAARRFPMMSERQVVIVKEAKDIQDLNRQEGQTALTEYLKNPVPTTLLVFAHKHKKIDGRKPLGKALPKSSVFLTSEKLKEYELQHWIEQWTKGLNLSIEHKSVQMLVEYIGNDLERLSNEINKVAINLKPGEAIAPFHIEKYVGIHKDFNVFELKSAVSHRNIEKTMRIVHHFMANIKANPVIPTVAILFSYFSNLLIYHGLNGHSDQEKMKAMGVPAFVMKEYQMGARNYPLGKVVQNISILRSTDLQAKGVGVGSTSQEEILKEFIYKMMH